MSIFKCKMCGGNVEFEQGETTGVCDSCGTRQTLPKIDDERRANLYDRANHFRRNNEFDKAEGIYEQILNEDTEDAEAYWSLVLCRYGIEYVEDSTTHKRIPTVNRTQFTSIYDDDNYQSALRYADSSQKSLYEEEAKTINEIQKGILEISRKEEPFDVFICYKETDQNGRRTQDSVLANDLYHQLTQEGFKVFFSRITLEDKLGTAYEPYIFAALNSARVMVVIGTKPEHFNAVWVKNEWSRYLALIKKGEEKTLIPAYRDMDPYDLPEEFSHLQAQDMSKLGFMQDLIRGIGKITRQGEKLSKTPIMAKPVPVIKQASAEQLLSKARTLGRMGNYKEEMKIYVDVTQEYPQNPYGWYHLARLRSQNFTVLQGQVAWDSVKLLKTACACASSKDTEIMQDSKDYLKDILSFDKSVFAKENAEYIAARESQDDMKYLKIEINKLYAEREKIQNDLKKVPRFLKVGSVILSVFIFLAYSSANNPGVAIVSIIFIQILRSMITRIFINRAERKSKALYQREDNMRSKLSSMRFEYADKNLGTGKPSGVGDDLRNVVTEQLDELLSVGGS